MEAQVKETFPRVAVIVLNYNGKRFLNDCFRSLLNSTYPEAELIMYDNKSTDDSLVYMLENFPSVRLIAGDRNAGYSRAYNEAVKFTNAPYAVFLNNDVKVDPGWLEPMVKVAESDDSVAALQPKLLLFKDQESFEYSGAAGGEMDIYGYPFARGRVFFTLEKDKGQYDEVSEIFWSCGAALFVRRSVFIKSGGLDEDFVHHMEEIDLCWRFHLVGYKLKSVPVSRVYHHGGATIAEQSYQKVYWNHRNSLFMLIKNLSAPQLRKSLFVRFILDVVSFFQSLFSFKPTRARALFMAYMWLLGRIPLLLKRREEVQLIRTRDDEEVLKSLYPRSVVVQYFLRGKKTFTALKEAYTKQQHAINKDSRISQRLIRNNA